MTAPDPNAQNNNTQNVNNGSDVIPGWARQQITDANNEAASRRIELQGVRSERDGLQGQLNTANSEKDSAVTRAETAEKRLLRIEVAINAGVPVERLETVVQRLQGNTEDELKADAAKLVADFGITAPAPNDRPTDHSQGRGSETPAVPNTPEAAFAQMWADHFK